MLDVINGAGAPDWVRSWLLTVVVIAVSILVSAAIFGVRARLDGKKIVSPDRKA